MSEPSSASSASAASEASAVCTPLVKRLRGGAEPLPGTEALLSKKARASWRRDVSLEDLRSDMASFAQEREWDQFHTPRNVLLALVGEVGELAELFQWAGDEKCGVGLDGWGDKQRVHLGEELSDVLLYLVRLADRCGVDLPSAALRKMEKNKEKYPASRVRGSSRKYNEYKNERTWADLSGEEVVQAAALVGVPRPQVASSDDGEEAHKEQLVEYLASNRGMDKATSRAMLVRVASTLATLRRDVDVVRCSKQ